MHYSIVFPFYDRDVRTQRRVLFHYPCDGLYMPAPLDELLIIPNEQHPRGMVAMVTEVSKVPLLDLSEDDLIKLGGITREDYLERWDLANPDYPTNTSPEVWKIEFKYGRLPLADWTSKDGKVKNTSELYNYLSDRVAAVLESESRAILSGDSIVVGRMIMSQLAHVHGLVPKDQKPSEEEPVVLEIRTRFEHLRKALEAIGNGMPDASEDDLKVAAQQALLWLSDREVHWVPPTSWWDKLLAPSTTP